MQRRPGAVLLRVTVGLVVGAALLSGCAAKEKASTSLPAPTSTPAPTTAALPPLGPPDFPVPAAARTKDAAGAEAFTRYWIDLVNHQRAIPAGQPIRELGPHCQDCVRIARLYDTARASGYAYRGGELSETSPVEALITGDRAISNFTVRRAAEQRVNSRGAAVDQGQPPAGRIIVGIALSYSADLRGWLVEGFNLG